MDQTIPKDVALEIQLREAKRLLREFVDRVCMIDKSIALKKVLADAEVFLMLFDTSEKAQS